MKITIISNYLSPERGAAPNRITSLARELAKENQVEVVAPLPNYPTGKIFDGYRHKVFLREDLGGFVARRYWSYSSNSKNPIKRGFAMLSFGLMLFFESGHLLKSKPQIVIIQNSPLLVSFFGILVTKIFSSAKVVLNVSDLWPLSALELGVVRKGRFYSFLETIELSNYRKSDFVIGQSEEILQHVVELVPNKGTSLYRNVPNINVQKKTREKNNKLKLVYAGLLGVAQGVYEICTHLNFSDLGVEFHIFGAGNEQTLIEQIAIPGSNIFFHGSVEVDELRQALDQFDFAIVPLKNRIFGAVPSKVFEMSMLGIPMIFAGGGEGAEIINKYGIGFASPPGDFAALRDNIDKAKSLSDKEYNVLVENCFTSSSVHFNFKDQIQNLNSVLNGIK